MAVVDTRIDPGDQPPRRAVVLGASNVMWGLSPLVTAARCAWGTPLDLMIAAGHGRSYGVRIRVLGRALPGILDCGVWDALRSSPAAPTAALITDIGNDLLFGVSSTTIVRWIERSIERLSEHSETITVAGLPVTSVTGLSRSKFHLARRLLFPRSQLTYETAMRECVELNDRVADLAEKKSLSFVIPKKDWYGIDPIHVRRSLRRSAWDYIFSEWTGANVGVAMSARERLRLWQARPLERTLFGVEQRRDQPAVHLRDSSTVSFF